jgi:hypothetical protein
MLLAVKPGRKETTGRQAGMIILKWLFSGAIKCSEYLDSLHYY